jgi:hypothetical protein
MSKIICEITKREAIEDSDDMDIYKGALIALQNVLSEYHRVFEGDYTQQIVALRTWLESEVKELEYVLADFYS